MCYKGERLFTEHEKRLDGALVMVLCYLGGAVNRKERKMLNDLLFEDFRQEFIRGLQRLNQIEK